MSRFEAVVLNSSTDCRICIRTSLFQGHISRLLILACIATAVASTVLGVSSLIWQTSAFYQVKIRSTCDSLQSSTDSEYGRVRFTDDSVWKTERCKEYLGMMMVRMEAWFPWVMQQPWFLGIGVPGEQG